MSCLTSKPHLTRSGKGLPNNPELSTCVTRKMVGEVQDASVAFRRYSLGATRNTRLNALLKAASES